MNNVLSTTRRGGLSLHRRDDCAATCCTIGTCAGERGWLAMSTSLIPVAFT